MIVPIINDDIREVPASVLAYIGDAVFELYVRLHVAARNRSKSGSIHKLAIGHVSAAAQAKTARAIRDILTEEELSVFRRGKNSNPASSARNASPSDYKYATGMEAVIGYLFLMDRHERLDEIIIRIFEISDRGDPSEHSDQ
ncbi:MAG: ribonuclease III domain-containing protein [Oscillospiraceae bacterium]|nr:ribonuclease III domain-containing protein [Oscillospiraceae bacterium]